MLRRCLTLVALIAAALPTFGVAAPFAYITNYRASTVSVVNTANNSVVATIPVDGLPVGVAVNATGTRAYVASNLMSYAGVSRIAIIDTATQTVLTNVVVGAKPYGIAVNTAGTRVYVTNMAQGNNTVSVMDTASNAVVATVSVGFFPIAVAVNPAGTRAFVVNNGGDSVSVIDAASNVVVGTVPIGGGPVGIAINTAGTRAYVANQISNTVSVIDTASLAVVKTIPVGTSPIGIAVNPAGTLVYAVNQISNNVSVIDAATNAVVGTIGLGSSPKGVSFTPDGARAYVAISGSNQVSVIDTATRNVIANIPVGYSPYALGQFIVPPAAGSPPPPPPADTTAPGVSIASPTGGNVSGTVTVSATATDNVGVARVDFYVNGALAGSDSSATYSYVWNTTTLANGSATLRAVAYDAAGNVGQSSLVTVNVSNAVTPPADTTAPTATLTSPTGGTVSGTVTVSATAQDNIGVARVQFYVNGGIAAISNSAPYQFSWNTTTLANGAATLRATAFDAAGNSGSSALVTVNVANSVTNPPPPSVIRPSDVNGDGRSDIVMRNTTTGVVSVWQMNGLAVQSASTIGTVADTAWQLLGDGDFDGDGKADLLWRNTVTGDVNVWFLDGTIVKPNSGKISNLSATQWKFSGIADVNGDRKADILWRNLVTGGVYVWMMNGGVWLPGSGAIAYASFDWQIAGVGDLDGDGKADLLWQNTSTGDVYAWLLDGAQMRAGSGMITRLALGRWSVIGIGDTDGDGKADIAWRDATNGDVHVWFMSGLSMKAGSGRVGNAPLSTAFVGVADYDGDGKSDMLWRRADQMVGIWFMNGPSIKTASGNVGTVTSAWQLVTP